jgi:hypothetical protein
MATLSFHRARVNRLGSAGMLIALATASGLLASCKDFLTAENPSAIEMPQLNDSTQIPLLINGVIGDFQGQFSEGAFWHALFTDELRNHHAFFENPQLDRRDISPDNGTYAIFFYNPLHRARFMADTVAGFIRALKGPAAAGDTRLARVLAYGGYSYVLLAETQCEIPINVSAPFTPDEIFQQALAKFDSAIAIATAARAAAPPNSAALRTADSLLNFARVGAARAALNLNDKTRALGYANAVLASDTNFRFLSYHSINSTRETNRMWNFLTAEVWGSLDATPFLAMAGDPRVPRPDSVQRVVDGTSRFVPNSPTALSTYTGTRQGGEFDRAAHTRIASALEARYIWAEATGPTPQTIAWLETRRLIAPTGTTVTDATNFAANLRDQRSRDLYMDFHRLGDLRRYKRYYSVDLFQRGPYPGSTTGEQYGTQECMPLTRAELNAQQP